MHITNPSFFGLNSWNRSGLLYLQLRSIQMKLKIINSFYGSYSFDLQNFSLGVQFNNFTAPNIGYKKE